MNLGRQFKKGRHAWKMKIQERQDSSRKGRIGKSNFKGKKLEEMEDSREIS